MILFCDTFVFTMLETITLLEMLDDMRKVDADGKPIPFSVKVVSFDEQKKTGGKIIEYPCAIMPIKQQSDEQEQESIFTVEQKTKKDPRHFKNSTRNIEEVIGGYPTNRVRKVNIFLILVYNGREVIIS